MEDKARQILLQIKDNISKKSYKPLSAEDSKIIREFYISNLLIPVNGDNETKFYTKSNTRIAIGYQRVVVGDYGAYIEFNDDQIDIERIGSRWAGTPTRKVKYIWMETRDESKTKVYWQKDTVVYADYKADMYYIDPADLHTNNLDILYKREPTTRVVHCKKEPYDVYIGRPGIWGNPFSWEEGTFAKYKVATREEAIEKYREYVLSNEELLNKLKELKGKILGCWCKPLLCHGDILVELIERM